MRKGSSTTAATCPTSIRPASSTTGTHACCPEYFAPAVFDDLIEIFIRIKRIGRTSVTYECAAYRVSDDLLMVTAEQTLVLIDFEQRRPTPIPDWYRDAMRAFEGEDLDA